MDDVDRHAPDWVAQRLADVREARANLEGLCEALEAVLADESPNLRALFSVLDHWERALRQVGHELTPRLASSPVDSRSAMDPQPDHGTSDATSEDSERGLDPSAPPDLPAGGQPLTLSAWHSRDEAYRTLEALARYLMTIEPHSPTPYLVRRAVNWGRLPLPELMAEIMQEEGDLNRMVQLLGLRR